jgi:hypothetical protein
MVRQVAFDETAREVFGSGPRHPHHSMSICCQALGRRQSDAAGGTGDEDCAVGGSAQPWPEVPAREVSEVSTKR